MARLSDVCEINPRFSPSTVGDAELASFVPMASVSEVSGSIAEEQVRPAASLLKGFTPFQDRDVLVAKITPCFENGKIAHARISHRHGFGSTEFHVLRPDRTKLDDRYLFHFMRQAWVRSAGEKRMTGSGGQRRVPRQFLEELDISTPSLVEQRRIAAILDKADALRAKRHQAIGGLDDLLGALFIKMFGDPNDETSPGNRISFLSLFLDASAGHVKIKQEDYLKSGMLPIVDQGKVLIGGYSNNLENRSVSELPVIVFGDHTRCVKFVDFPFCVGADGVKLLRPRDGDDPLFLYWWLKLRCIPSAGYSRHFKFLKEVRIRRPPFEEQCEFSKIAKFVAAIKLQLERAQLIEDELFLSLQNSAFSGRI